MAVNNVCLSDKISFSGPKIFFQNKRFYHCFILITWSKVEPAFTECGIATGTVSVVNSNRREKKRRRRNKRATSKPGQFCYEDGSKLVSIGLQYIQMALSAFKGNQITVRCQIHASAILLHTGFVPLLPSTQTSSFQNENEDGEGGHSGPSRGQTIDWGRNERKCSNGYFFMGSG